MEEFADRYMTSIKALDDHRDIYVRNLALLVSVLVCNYDHNVILTGALQLEKVC